MPAPEDLVGVWRLTSHLFRDPDGSTAPGPLGPTATGLLIYHPDGYLSASLMRPASPPPAYMGYSGRWHLTGDTVTHHVEISSHPHLVGTAQTRSLHLSAPHLTLTEHLPNRSFVLTWHRVPAPD
jgi:hypothetical protein